MDKIKVGTIQQSCSTDKNKNLEKTIRAIHSCAEEGAQLIVLQELHSSIYFCQAEDTSMFDLAETIPGNTSKMISETAKKLQVVIVCSLFEKRAAGIYHNTAVVYDNDGSQAGIYRKMHIPDDPAYYEKFYFTPGDLGFNTIKTSIGNLGVLVCWDQWYPEAARLMALDGADILIYPTAIGWESSDDNEEKKRQLDAWKTSQRAHAIANGIPVVSVNRVGLEKDWTGVTGGITFWGNSFISGPQGEILFEASQQNESFDVTEINLKRSEDVRRIWPFFRDRRIDAYGDLMKRFRD